MPRLDGVEFVKRLRRLSSFQETFTVAITGLCGPLAVAATREAGFDGHLEKPMSAEMLARVLHRAGWRLTRGRHWIAQGAAGVVMAFVITAVVLLLPIAQWLLWRLGRRIDL